MPAFTGNYEESRLKQQMGNRTKQRRAGALTLLLYQRPLHPELFKILAAEKVNRRTYDADVWLIEGGHVVSFTTAEGMLAEVITTGPEPATDRGLIQSISCRGEKYHEMTGPGGIKYMISTQEEQLSPNLYEATRQEIAAYAAKRELLTAEIPGGPDSQTGPGLSVLDIERCSHELRVQSFHLFDDSQMVIKTQAIMEVPRA